MMGKSERREHRLTGSTRNVFDLQVDPIEPLKESRLSLHSLILEDDNYAHGIPVQ